MLSAEKWIFFAVSDSSGWYARSAFMVVSGIWQRPLAFINLHLVTLDLKSKQHVTAAVLELLKFRRTREAWVFYQGIDILILTICCLLTHTSLQMLASCRAFHGGVFSWLSAHATQVMHMLVWLFYVGDSIPRGFSKKSQIIKGNRASFEYFWLSLILCSVFIFIFYAHYWESLFSH